MGHSTPLWQRMKRLDRANPQASAPVPSLRHARGGRGRALDDLLSRQVSRVRRWASGWLALGAFDLDATTDVVQESVQLFLRRSVLERMREDKARTRGQPALATDVGVADPGEGLPLRALLGADGTTRYYAALDRMPAEDREAVVARLELGYNYDQIALVLGRSSADAARAVVARGLGQLATEMDRG
jgi:RNA polymerase sigma-70 factor (ECF subfamily)